ncbi:hypothetical protein EYS09_05375 [Streptomyces kasugaensis]|uniref:Uncharacterized protein n=1 Tax=Streptomyces kasugaensis TaxID=1946 RepID=A0A4Q9HZC6_STRKA|nr:hypothetical protein EYS09_05375 [Streptomyces kasugaensis]
MFELELGEEPRDGYGGRAEDANGSGISPGAAAGLAGAGRAGRGGAGRRRGVGRRLKPGR